MKKNIILFLGLVLAIILVIVTVGQMRNTEKKSEVEQKNEQVKDNGSTTKKFRLNSARADEEHITVREAAIKNFYDFHHDFPTAYPKTIIQGRTFFMIGYEHGYLPGADTPTGGGVIVFEQRTDGKFNLLWESKESIVRGESGYSSFQDLTNDGIPEIVVQDSASATGQNTSYYVYAWRNNTFQLVTPLQVVTPLEPWGRTNATKIGGDNAETYIKDIDNDKIMEIIDGYISDTDHMLHQEIYKWNGKEYYLWKKVVEKKKYE